ncbi:helix-turn-helix domain-containing protein [Nocardia sp. NPDC051030]|uniref:MmyB family transcriptional regulator n=1 Tax=Nocardia sp. NPDC051030 TaxID=3155162 RepID=UPI00342C0D5F
MLLSHTGSGPFDEETIHQPTFGTLLRRMRDDRGITRDRLAKAANVSASYITHLEHGQRGRPTHSVVEALIGCLHDVRPVTNAERRHLFDLAGLEGTAWPSVENLRATLSSGSVDTLYRHEPWPAAYLDTRSNVLRCNDSYERTFTGILDNGSVLRWVFLDPRSKQVLAQWQHEAELTVSLVHGFMGRSEHPEWWADTLEELSDCREFQKIWNSCEAGYGRDPAWMALRHPDSGETYHLDLRVFQHDSVDYRDQILFIAGFGTTTDPRQP